MKAFVNSLPGGDQHLDTDSDGVMESVLAELDGLSDRAMQKSTKAETRITAVNSFLSIYFFNFIE